MEIVLYSIHIVVAIFLVLVILLQQGKGSDMGAAFGGASSTVFGGASGRQSFLVQVTVGLAVVFLLMSLGLSWRASQIHKKGPGTEAPGEAPMPTLPLEPTPGAALPTTPGAPSPGLPAPTEPMPTAPVSPEPSPQSPGNK